MSRIRPGSVAGLVGLMVVACAPMEGHAADEEASESGTIQNVEVNADRISGPIKGFVAKADGAATKTATDLIETPQAVTVIGEDRMEALNVRSVSDAMRYAAGVSDYGGRDDPRGYTGSIRGFSADTYLDGLRLPAAAASQTFDLEPYGLERFDVLRGASSALYGGGSLGGIINGVSKTPHPDQTDELAIQGGSFGRIQGMADLGGSLTDDGSLLWRLNGLVRNSGTQFDNIKNNRIYVAPSLKWSDERTSITLLASYMQIEAGSSSQFLPAVGTVLYNPYGQIPRDTLNGDPNFDVYSKREASVGYEFEHDFDSGVVFRQNLRLAHIDLNYRYVTAVSFLANDKTLTRQALLQSSTFNNLSMDNQLEYKLETGPLTHDLLAGIDFSQQFLALRRGQLAASSINIFDPVYTPVKWPTYGSNIMTNQNISQAGFYAQDQVGFGNWRLTLTGREDITDSALRNFRTAATTNSDPDAFTYRTALLYASPLGISPYVSYATSFQIQNGTDFNGQPFAPMTGDQVEAGVKYKPPGSNMMLTADAFDLTQQNVLTTDPNNSGFSVQTGEQRTRGVEFEAVATLMENMNLIAALTFQDPRITKTTVAGELGNRPDGIPSQMASLYLDKSWTIDQDLSFGLGAGVRYNGDTEGTDPNTWTVPSQTMGDLNGHIDWQKWRMQVNATNITDARTIAACTRLVACSYGTGRAVYATLSYRW